MNSSQDEKHDTKMKLVPQALQSSSPSSLILHIKSPKNFDTMESAKKRVPRLSLSYQKLNVSAPQKMKERLNDEQKDSSNKSIELMREAPPITNHEPTIGLITSHT